MGLRRYWTLKTRLIVFFVLIVIVAMLFLQFSNYYLTRNQQIRHYLEYNQRFLTLTATNIESQLKQILDISLIPYRESSLYNALTLTGGYSHSSQIIGTLMSILNSHEAINQVHLYSEKTKMDYVARPSATGQIHLPRIHDVPTNLSIVSLGCKLQSDYGIPFSKNPEKPIMTLSRALYSFPANQYIGELDIDIDPSSFFTNLDPINEDEILVLVFTDGEICTYCLAGDVARAEQILGQLSFTKEFDRVNITTDQDYTVLYQQIQPHSQTGDFYLVKIIATKKIHESFAQIIRHNLILGLLIIVLSTALITKMASNYTKPFGYIEEQLKRIEKGDLDVTLDLKSHDEFGVLARQFNDMISSINTLFIRGYQLEIQNKSYQLKALQAQLNPHFINNTLQTLGSEALKCNNLKLYTAILQFGEMMRYTMDFLRMEVLFKDELEYSENYLKFQSMRFNTIFTYNITATEKAKNTVVPKLLLQPLVENIFKHGLSDNQQPLRIIIDAVRENSLFRLTCSNTGNTLTDEQLEELRNLLKEARTSNQESPRIGLINMARRLHLVYGDDATLRIDSCKPSGFTVEITITVGEG